MCVCCEHVNASQCKYRANANYGFLYCVICSDKCPSENLIWKLPTQRLWSEASSLSNPSNLQSPVKCIWPESICANSFQLISSYWQNFTRSLNTTLSTTVVKLTNGLLAALCAPDACLPRTSLYLLLRGGGTTRLLFEARAKKFSGLANTVGEITWQTKYNRLTRYANTRAFIQQTPFFIDSLRDRCLLPLNSGKATNFGL